MSRENVNPPELGTAFKMLASFGSQRSPVGFGSSRLLKFHQDLPFSFFFDEKGFEMNVFLFPYLSFFLTGVEKNPRFVNAILSHFPVREAKFDLSLHFASFGIGEFFSPSDQSLAEQLGCPSFAADQYAIGMTGGSIGFEVAGLDRA